ncbi:hypothetical protein VE25_07040 [Devosia geojensis]|uniref:Alkaline phosphatase n=1 Tax=Devosia geojensis TaxID=443610 RepID=A0A0F5FUE6_9HYPH|nr:alkaline phosphatase D family protein [Devosia geojensis]KKB12491.1 hypothetical protein VE25_07040 [Devosia geojensis]
MPWPKVDRRHFLASGLAAAAVWPMLGSVRAQSFDSDPFTLGVASGCPEPQSVVLWTRLVFPAEAAINMADPFAPAPAAEFGPLDVAWEIAEDEAFTRPVQSGIAPAVPDYAHSVHVEVRGLEPERWYFYRFRCRDAESPVGRTRTAPAADAAPGRFSFAFASCQQYEQGYYGAYRDMAQRELDLVVHLGDYVYEKSYGANLVRRHGAGVPTLLYEYRDRYALYKSDPDLKAAHAAFPWLAVWDDHEVINNYAKDQAPDAPRPEIFLEQRRAAYQAWYEHMPVPPRAAPDFSNLTIYGLHGFGQLIDIALLDTRQYRSPMLRGSAALDTEERTLLGAEQERWLDGALKGSKAKWTIVGQQTLLCERDTAAGPDTAYNLDGWDGYRSARTRLLDSVAAAGTANPIVIGGDLHAFYAAEVKRDFHDEKAPTFATEFVTGSITSDGPSDASIATALAENPHLKYASGRDHGYALMHLSDKQARTEFVTVSDRKDPQASARVGQGFVVLDGVPGVNRV